MNETVIKERIPSSADWEEPVYREVTVETYCFEDWIEGRISTGDKCEIFQNQDADSGMKNWVRINIPAEVQEEIKLEAEVLYWTRVERKFEAMKHDFLLHYNTNVDKATLLQDEIHSCQLLLLTHKITTILQDHNLAKRYTSKYSDQELNNIRSYYRRIIKKDRDFTQTNSCASGNSRDGLYITAEVFAWYLVWLNNYAESVEAAKIKSTSLSISDKQESPLIKNVPSTLADIWIKSGKTADSYTKVLEKLQKPYGPISKSFVTIKDGKIFWDKYPVKGWVQYLIAFTKTCIDNNWIGKNHSAPELRDILCTTFNIEHFNHGPLKSIVGSGPLPKYMAPFKNLKNDIS